MTQPNYPDDRKIEKILNDYANTPARDPESAQLGKERFLSQARELAPEVSERTKERHTGWNTNFFERILKHMKPRTKLTTLTASLAVLLIVAVFVARNFTTVSAQQIMDRADAVRTSNAAATGIQHTIIEVFESSKEFAGDQAGNKTIQEEYLDLSSGNFRVTSTDPDGNLLNGSASDGKYTYSFDQASKEGITVTRTPITADEGRKLAAPDTQSTPDQLFKQFKHNPSVKLEDTITWTDGSKAYVLVLKSYKTDGSGQKTYTGSSKMTFNAKTYALLESVSTMEKDGQDEVIADAKFTTDELLPAGTQVAWDLSDLKGVTYADQPAPAPEEVTFGTLTVDELASKAQAYILQPVPEGYALEIDAVTNQPADQEFQYEVNYKLDDKTVFGMQYVGELSSEFIQESFSDGSFKAANGLQIFYSTSHPANGNGVAAVLVTPDAGNYLLSSTLSRDEVQKLVETLIHIK
jgi:hypothetical protein